MRYILIILFSLFSYVCLGQKISPKQIDTASLFQDETLNKVISRDSNVYGTIVIHPPYRTAGLIVDSGLNGSYTITGDGFNMHAATSGGWARALLMWNNAHSTALGGVGFYGTGNTVLYGFLGSGTTTYNGADLRWINGTVGINLPTNITPSATLDVNGGTRIRSINNTAGNFVTTQSNGLLTQRTPSQTASDIGAITTETDPLYTNDKPNIVTIRGTSGSSDANDYRTAGYYSIANDRASGGTNWPTASGGMLLVYPYATHYTKQEYTPYNSESWYARTMTGEGNWSAWRSVTTTVIDSLMYTLYKTKETVTINNDTLQSIPDSLINVVLIPPAAGKTQLLPDATSYPNRIINLTNLSEFDILYGGGGILGKDSGEVDVLSGYSWMTIISNGTSWYEIKHGDIY